MKLVVKSPKMKTKTDTKMCFHETNIFQFISQGRNYRQSRTKTKVLKKFYNNPAAEAEDPI